MRLLLGGYLIETKLVNQYCIKVPSSISIYATIYPNYLSINTIYIYINIVKERCMKYLVNLKFPFQKNWVFATNSDFLI